jgi:hypothetical protein
VITSYLFHFWNSSFTILDSNYKINYSRIEKIYKDIEIIETRKKDKKLDIRLDRVIVENKQFGIK